MEDQPTDSEAAGVRAVVRILRKAYKDLPGILNEWEKVRKMGMVDAESLENQMEQRKAVSTASLAGTSVGALPNFKERLVAKIDYEITRLCQSLLHERIPRAEALRQQVEKQRAAAGQLANQYELCLESISASTPTRPSIHSLNDGLDFVISWMQSSLKSRTRSLADLSPSSRSSEELKASWRTSYADKQYLDFILFRGNVLLHYDKE